MNFGSKANYEIKVKGKVDPSLSGILGGMKVQNLQVSEKTSTSTLTGQISDQAALSGILNTLYEMHLPIILVKCLDETNDKK